MKNMGLVRLKNQVITKILARIPFIQKMFIKGFSPVESIDIPWTQLRKPLAESRIAIVTTAGVHFHDQEPFNMTDPDGDPTFRVIDVRRPLSDLMITHDYYDHTDADRDINVVFPIDRLRELARDRVIAGVSHLHYAFMGHIKGNHITTLKEIHAADVARRLLDNSVDSVLLTPG